MRGRWAAGLLLLLGCGDPGATAPAAGAPRPTQLASSGQPIVGGHTDSEHRAVAGLVALDGGEVSLCSGTIVHVDAEERMGYLLTAAHCVQGHTPVQILEGADLLVPDATYEVHDAFVHPLYDGEQYDFAVVRFYGAGVETPVIPVLGPEEDRLMPGDRLLGVGYGATRPFFEQTEENTRRHHGEMPIGEVTPLLVLGTAPGAGTCSGDSGGPMLVDVAGVEYVAAVHAAADRLCAYRYMAGRASAVLRDFVEPLFERPVDISCRRCRSASRSGRGECAALARACDTQAECREIIDCVNACGNEAGCRHQCVRQGGAFALPFVEAEWCFCDACADSCGSCEPPGFDCAGSGGSGCDGCARERCCAEADACWRSRTCAACGSGVLSSLMCDSNADYRELMDCLGAECVDACGLTVGSTDDGSGAARRRGAGAVASAGPAPSGCGCRTDGERGPLRLADLLAAGIVLVFAWRRR